MASRALSLVLAIIQLLVLVQDAASQTSAVICPSTYSWADNSLGQSPCVVAAYLLSVCSTTEVNIPALPVQNHYNPGDSSVCSCNTVVYSLVSACADCQVRVFDTWSQWSINCSTVYTSVFPKAIPSGTAVPAWAYLDVTAGEYNASIAMADTAPESTPPVSSPTTSGPGFSTPPFPTTVNPPTSTKSSSKVPVAAIAGGAAGGIVVLALIGGSIAWLLYRKPKPSYGAPDKITPTMMPTSQYTLDTAAPSFPQVQHKLYDPSDPSTFPDAGMNHYNATPPPVGMSPPPMGVTPPPMGIPSPPPMGMPSPPPMSMPARGGGGYNPNEPLYTQYHGAPQV